MKKLVHILSLFFITMIGYSQKTLPESFKIINNTHPEKESFYISSIEKANMENYRLKDKEVTLHFENGFDCILIPAKTLFLEGKKVNATNYQEKFSDRYTLPVFNVLSTGNLTAVYKTEGKFK